MKNKIALLSLLLITNFLYGCNNADDQNQNSIGDHKTLKLVDSLTINNVDDYYTSLVLAKRNNKIAYQYLSKNKSNIYIIDENKNLTDSLPIEKELRDRQFFYYIDSQKYLYLLIPEEKTILKYQRNNKIAKYVFHEKGSELKYFMCMNFPFEVRNNTVVLNNISNYKIFITDDRKKYFSEQFLSKFVLRNDSIVTADNFFRFPEAYVDNYYAELFPVITLLNEDSIAYVFSTSYQVHIYDIRKEQDHSFTMKGLIKNEIMPYPADSIKSLMYAHKYELNNDKFLKTMRDEVTGKFMIIQLLKVDHKNFQTGFAPHYKDKPVRISILDTSFRVTDQYYMKDQKDNFFYGSIFLNNKFYVPQFTNENKNKIQVFQLN